MAAKKKVKSKKKSKPIKRRTNKMATKRAKPRKKKRSTTSIRRAMSAAPARKRRRKKKGLSDGISKKGAVESLKTNAGGAVGGGLILLSRFVPMPFWLRISGGYAGAFLAGMLKAPSVGAGMSGATTYKLGENLFAKMNIPLLNDDAENVDWVDANTLQDTDLEDEDGNAVVMDDDDVLYSLQDSGELLAIGDANDFDLADDDDEGMDDDDDSLDDDDDNDLQSVSMIPLQDIYDLSNDNYALASGY